VRLIFRWTGGVIALAVAVIVPYQVDQFLASDPHFILPGAAQAKGNPNFTVEGVVYTPANEVARVFADDFGRSIYLMPLSERRRALLRIDWIRDASISRRWPNRVLVRIIERRPVAFLMLPAAGTYEAVLIDGEGVILRRPERARVSLPVLYGVTRTQTPAVRRARMQQVGQMMKELDSYSRQLSEIDVSSPEDVVVTQAVQGRAVRLRLGDRNYRERLESFLRNYGDISKRLPNARTFDLRLDNYFTAEEGGANAR
jgi:cell division protein FtsQ